MTKCFKGVQSLDFLLKLVCFGFLLKVCAVLEAIRLCFSYLIVSVYSGID